MPVVASASNYASFNKNSFKEQSRINIDMAGGSDSASVSSTEALTMTNTTQTQSSGRIVHVSETARSVKVKIVRELEDVTEAHFEDFDLEAYLAYIADERLVHMPTKGSQWDRVLKGAEFFGLQLDEFASQLRRIVPEWASIRDTALASCCLLLEVCRPPFRPSRTRVTNLTTARPRSSHRFGAHFQCAV